LLLDRGCCDSKAYLSPEEWEMVVEELETTEMALRDRRYDCVLHLVTAADGAPHAYGSATNAQRTENAKEAVALDRLTRQAWMGHPHLFVIDNSSSFEEKVDRILDRVASQLGEDYRSTGTINRKFLLANPITVETLTQRFPDAQVFELEQMYLLPASNNREERIRKRTQGGLSTYTHQVWQGERLAENGSTVEVKTEALLTAREYLGLIPRKEPHTATQHKTLVIFYHQSNVYEVNIFRDQGIKYAVIEVEEAEGSDHRSPLHDLGFAVAKEVTHLPTWDSHFIAKLIFSDPEGMRSMFQKATSEIQPDQSQVHGPVSWWGKVFGRY